MSMDLFGVTGADIQLRGLRTVDQSQTDHTGSDNNTVLAQLWWIGQALNGRFDFEVYDNTDTLFASHSGLISDAYQNTGGVQITEGATSSSSNPFAAVLSVVAAPAEFGGVGGKIVIKTMGKVEYISMVAKLINGSQYRPPSLSVDAQGNGMAEITIPFKVV